QDEDPDTYSQAWGTALTEAKDRVASEADEVTGVGGLYVLGTERHESRRIDNQLRGRSGRQGDPGESRFYLSLGDDLMQRFNGNAVEAIMDRLNIPDDVPIESKLVSRQIQSAQTQLEQQNAEIRKNVLKYDEVLNKQRQVIYAERKQVLDGADLQEQVRHMIDDSIEAYVAGATSDGYAEDWDLDQLITALKQLYPVSFTVEALEEEVGSRDAIDAEFLTDKLKSDANEAYDRREKELGAEALRELERQVVLSVLDRKWREHLYEMDYLQEGIGLRAYAQRDPLVEYQREGFDLFNAMMDGIKEESVGFLFNLEVQVDDDSADGAEHDHDHDHEHHVEVHAKGLGAPSLPANLQYSAPVIDGAAGAGAVAVAQGTPFTAGPASPTQAGERSAAPGQKVGAGPSRNAPCPCGSGKKYKRCHGAPGGPA
ncbi:MAG: preprotein translocase subunit SecA, partial [Cryptosporangiaceae bacterium]|nr:preprotein translocase subunit SecA [Cryptosporangiaceae bacterium]